MLDQKKLKLWKNLEKNWVENEGKLNFEKFERNYLES